MILLAQIDEAMRQVDQAALRTDRWMFIATLVILIFFAGTVMRWLVTHLSDKDKRADLKDREHDEKLKLREEQARLERQADQTKFLASLQEFEREVSATTKAVETLTEVVVAHDKHMRHAHEVETAAIVRAEIIRLGFDPERK